MTLRKLSYQKDPRLKRTLYSDVEIFGLDELQRAMRSSGMSKEAQRQIKNGSKAIANHVLKRSKSRSKGIPRSTQYGILLPSMRAVQARTPAIRFGGAKATNPSGRQKGRQTVRKRSPAGSEWKWPPPAGYLVYGAEFGGQTIRDNPGNTMMFNFKKTKKPGYAIYPSIRRSHEFIKKTYNKNLEKAIRKRY